MNKILLLILIIFPIFSFSQYENIRMDRNEIPCYILANESDTLGVIFSVPDVQKIDKSLELLEYLEKRSYKIDTTLYYYVSLTGDLELKNNLLNDKLDEIMSRESIKDITIGDLKSKIEKFELGELSSNAIIKNLEKDNRKQRLLKVLYPVGVALVSVLTIIMILKGPQ